MLTGDNPLVPPNLRDVEAVERVTEGDRHGDRRDGAHDDVLVAVAFAGASSAADRRAKDVLILPPHSPP